MNKSTKGALAAGAGAVLLLGGAGSLAYWNDAATIAGGTINSGKLSLTDTTTGGSCAAATWTIDTAETPSGVAFNPATDTVVPGDVLTKRCTYKVNAAGTHLRATLVTSGGAATGTLASTLTTAGTFTVGGAAATSITSADDGKTLDASIKVTFPYGATADNSTQLKTATLSNFVVTLTQVHN